MSTVHVTQHIRDEATRVYLLRSRADDQRFHGLAVPLGDAPGSRQLEFEVAFSNPAFVQSVSAALERGSTAFEVRDGGGVVRAASARMVDDVLVCQAGQGQTLVAASPPDGEASAAVGVVAAVAFVASVAILTIGAVGVAAMNGTFSGSASSGGEGTDVTVKASAETPK